MENPDLVLQETGSRPTYSRLNYVPSGDTLRRDAISSFYLDLWWFIHFLHVFNGVNTCHTPVQHKVFIDATLTHVGAAWGSRMYSLPLPDLVQGLPINQCEMFNKVVCLHMWGECWTDKVISVNVIMRVRYLYVILVRQRLSF